MNAAIFMPWIFVCILFLIFGGVIGYFVSRHYNHNSSSYINNDSSNRSNQLNWGGHHNKQQQRHIIPPRDKDINLLMQTNQFNLTSQNSTQILSNNKKDNLDLENEFIVTGKDRSHECKNSSESLEKEIPTKVSSAVVVSGGVGGGITSSSGTGTGTGTTIGTGTLQKVKKTYI